MIILKITLVFILCITQVVDSSVYVDPKPADSTLCKVNQQDVFYHIKQDEKLGADLITNVTFDENLPVCKSPTNTFWAPVKCTTKYGCERYLGSDNWIRETWGRVPRTKDINYNTTVSGQYWSCSSKVVTPCKTVSGLDCYSGKYAYWLSAQDSDQSYATTGGSGLPTYNEYPFAGAHSYTKMGFLSTFPTVKVLTPIDESVSENYLGHEDWSAYITGGITWWMNKMTHPMCPTDVALKTDYQWNSRVAPDAPRFRQDASTPEAMNVLCSGNSGMYPDPSTCHHNAIPLKWGINYDYVDVDSCELSLNPPSMVLPDDSTIGSQLIHTTQNDTHWLYPPFQSQCNSVCLSSTCDGDTNFVAYSKTTNSKVPISTSSSSCFCRWLQPFELWFRKNTTNYYTAIPETIVLDIDSFTHVSGQGSPITPQDFSLNGVSPYAGFLSTYPNDYNEYSILYKDIILKNPMVLLGYDINSINVNLLNKNLNSVSCTPNIVDHTLRVPCSADVTVVMDFINYGFTEVTVNLLLTKEIPDEIMRQEGTMNFRFYQGSTIVGTASLFHSAETSCQQQDCTMCTDTLRNFDCQTTAVKALTITLLVLTISASLIVLGWACYALTVAAKLTCCTLYYTCSCCKKITGMAGSGYVKAVGHLKNGYSIASKLKSEESPSNPNDEIELDGANWQTMGINSARNQRMTSNFVILCVICLLMPVDASNCYGGITINSAVSTCTTNTTHETCAVSYDLIFTIPFSHASACFSFTNHANDSFMGQIEVNYMEMYTYLNLLKQYSTSSWTGYYEDDRTCWTPSNWCGDRCTDGTIAADDRSGYGRLETNEARFYPGYTSCDRTCGCAGCGCTYCDDACTIRRWTVVPKAPFTSIYSPSTYVQTPMIMVNYSLDGETFQQTLPDSMINSVAKIIPGLGTLEIVGAFASPAVTIGTKFVRLDDNNFAGLTDACQPNDPCMGLPGDIQAPNTLTLQTVPVIDTKVATNIRVGQSFATPGIDQAPSVTIPGLYLGRLWKRTGVQLVSAEIGAVPLLMRFSMSNPISVTRKFKTVCPVISSVVSGGCYACPQGGWVNITAKSSCLEGPALPYSDDFIVNDAQIFLFQSYNVYTLNIVSPSKFLSGTLHLQSGENDVTIHVESTLDDWSNFFSQGNFTAGHVTIDKGGNSWDDFLGFLSGYAFGSVISGLISTVIGIVGILFVIWLMKTLTQYVTQICKKRKEKKQV